MNQDTDRLFSAARNQIAIGNTKEAGRLISEILARDFLHSGAWELLYTLFGKNEGLEKFQLDFTQRWYPQKVEMMEAYQRGLNRAPARPTMSGKLPTPQRSEPARQYSRPPSAKTSPSRKQPGRGLIIGLGLLTAIALLTVCLLAGSLVIKKIPLRFAELGDAATTNTPGAREAVDPSSFFVLIDGDLTSQQQTSLDQLSAASDTPTTVRVRDGAVRFATMQIPIPKSIDKDPAARAQYVLEQHRDLFQLREGIDQLDVHSIKTSDDQSVHVWFSQVVEGVPVYESKIGVHFNPQGEVILINGGYLANTASLERPAERGINAADAGDLALEAMGWPDGLRGASAELTIFAPTVFGEPGAPRVAWLLTLSDENGTVLYDAVVDVQTAEILAVIPQFSAAFDLEIWDMKGARSTSRQGDAEIVADETGIVSDSFPVGTGDFLNWSEEIYNFCQSTFKRDSWDGQGGTIKILINLKDNRSCEGAYSFFNEDNGFGTNSITFCPRYDLYRRGILAHEFMHGVTATGIGLVSTGQPGALNEAFSDIFAELLEKYNPDPGRPEDVVWIFDMGEIGNRNYRDPTASDPRQITHVDQMENDPCHSLFSKHRCEYSWSSIPGHVAYLLAEGGETNSVQVEAIGYQKTAQLYYHAITEGYAPSNASFEDARDLLVHTCWGQYIANPEFVSHDCHQVMNAWASVGVGEAAPTPPTPKPTQEPTSVAETPTLPLPVPGVSPALPTTEGHIQVIGHDDLYSISTANGQSTRLATMPADLDIDNILPIASFTWVAGASPWSPDGSRVLLAYEKTGADGNREWELGIYSADGSNLTQVATNAGMGAWAPDGSRIAYVRWDEIDQTMSLYIQAADGAGAPAQIGLDSIRALGWSPDGTKIALVAGNMTLHIADINSLQITQITNIPSGIPTWSPDSTRLAFCAPVNGQGEIHAEIHTINADGSNHSLINDSGCYPAWSPVSEQIIFIEIENMPEDEWFREQTVGLCVMQSDGSAVRQIGEVQVMPDDLEEEGYVAVPFWSPDGTKFIFADLDEHREPYRLQVFDVNSSTPPKIIDCPIDEEGYRDNCFYPVWIP